MSDKEGMETVVCQCCGHRKDFPRRDGLWEYLERPIFDPDGGLVTGGGVGDHNARWVRVSVIDAGRFHGGGRSLRIVPIGMRRAIEWPERAIWRKVGESPEIDPGEVIDEGYRLKDDEWMGKWDDESEAVMRRIRGM